MSKRIDPYVAYLIIGYNGGRRMGDLKEKITDSLGVKHENILYTVCVLVRHLIEGGFLLSVGIVS